MRTKPFLKEASLRSQFGTSEQKMIEGPGLKSFHICSLPLIDDQHFQMSLAFCSFIFVMAKALLYAFIVTKRVDSSSDTLSVACIACIRRKG